MAGKKWNELSPRTRRLIIVAGGIETVLKAAALIDLARRPAAGVNGPKPAWAISIAVVSSGGAIPIVYFVRGRKN